MQSYEALSSTISLGIVSLTIAFLITKFSLFIIIMFLLLIASTVLLRFLLEDLCKIKELTMQIFNRKSILIVSINILSGIIILAILQGSMYFYFNYQQGYFFSFIIIFIVIGLYQLAKSNELLQNLNLTPLRIILTLYLPYYLYAVVLNLSLLELNVFNPLMFFSDIVIKSPLLLVANLSLYLVNNSPTDTFFIQILFLIILFLVVFYSLKKSFPLLQGKYSENEPWGAFKEKGIQLFPYLGMIYMVSILSSTNGLTELYQMSFWILVVSLLNFKLMTILKHSSVRNNLLYLRIIFWIILILVMQYINPLFLNIQFVQQLLFSTDQNKLLVFTLLYSLPSLLVILLLYFVLKRLLEPDKERLEKYSFFIILAVFISFFPFLTMRFLLIIILEFLATFYIFKWDDNQAPLSVINSINIKHSVIITFLSKISSDRQIILQKSSEIALFFLAYIIIM